MSSPAHRVAPDEVVVDAGSGPRTAGGPMLVPGTIVVVMLVTTGRWGSYLGWPDHQIFLTDILLAGSFGWLLLRHRPSVQAALGRGRLLWVLLPPLALIGWAVLRTLVDPVHADVLRDLAPYAYLGIGLLAAVPVSPAARLRTLQLLCAGLLVHAAWVTLSLLAPGSVSGLPLLGSTVRVLEVRGDFDGSQLGVLAALATYALFAARTVAERAALVAVACWAGGVVLILANRAALLALLLAMAIAVVLRRRELLGAVRQHLRIAAVAAVVVIAAGVVIVPETPIYQRITGAARFDGNSTAGTTNAREQAWRAVITYVDSSPTWVVAGVGMGPDFLKDSGAAVHYQDKTPGAKLVRQPHNYLVNTYARLGLIGLALLGWLLVSVAAAARTVRRPGPDGADAGDTLDIASVLMVSTLLITAMIGVILESPFGALPFGWAVGMVLSRNALRRGAHAQAS